MVYEFIVEFSYSITLYKTISMNLKKYVIMKRLLVYFVCLMAFLTYSENGYCQTGESYFQQGLEYHDAKDYENAAKCFLYSADRGHPGGLNMLGLYFMNGTALPRDPEKAFTLFKAAAERGESNAAHNVGRCYFKGDGVEKNYSTARDYYTKSVSASEAYRSHSLLRLGEMSYYGKGVAKNYKDAFAYYYKSAELGNSGAMYSLGWMYEHGQGVGKDVGKAREYYKKSADKGNEEAKKKLQELSSTTL